MIPDIVLHRCLLEVLESYRHKIPMALVEITSAGWDHVQARAFVADLENALPRKNPYALETLQVYMGTSDLLELKAALLHMLDITEGRAIAWNPSARDMQVVIM